MPDIKELTQEQKAELESERRKVRDTIREMLKTINDKETTDTQEITKMNQKLTGTLDELKHPEKVQGKKQKQPEPEQDRNIFEAMEEVISTFIVDVINFVQDKAEIMRAKIHEIKNPEQEQTQEKTDELNPFKFKVEVIERIEKEQQQQRQGKNQSQNQDFDSLKM